MLLDVSDCSSFCRLSLRLLTDIRVNTSNWILAVTAKKRQPEEIRCAWILHSNPVVPESADPV